MPRKKAVETGVRETHPFQVLMWVGTQWIEECRCERQDQAERLACALSKTDGSVAAVVRATEYLAFYPDLATFKMRQEAKDPPLTQETGVPAQGIGTDLAAVAYGRAGALMAKLAPELPTLREWMACVQMVVQAAATPDEQAPIQETWRQVDETIKLLIETVNLYHAAAGPSPLRLAYAHAIPRMHAIDIRCAQLQGYLSHMALSAAALTTEQREARQQFGEAHYTLTLLIETCRRYHTAAGAVFGGVAPAAETPQEKERS